MCQIFTKVLQRCYHFQSYLRVHPKMICWQISAQSIIRFANAHPLSTRSCFRHSRHQPLPPGYQLQSPNEYRPRIWLGWLIVIVGFGLMRTVPATDTLGKSIGCLVMLNLDGVCVVFIDRGIFMLKLSSMACAECDVRVPHFSPLSVTQISPALAFAWFVSSFAAVGILIPFYSIPTPSLTSWRGIIYHYCDRGHRRLERAPKEVSCVVYSIRPIMDFHHVRAHPKALHAPIAD